MCPALGAHVFWETWPWEPNRDAQVTDRCGVISGQFSCLNTALGVNKSRFMYCKFIVFFGGGGVELGGFDHGRVPIKSSVLTLTPLHSHSQGWISPTYIFINDNKEDVRGRFILRVLSLFLYPRLLWRRSIMNHNGQCVCGEPFATNRSDSPNIRSSLCKRAEINSDQASQDCISIFYLHISFLYKLLSKERPLSGLSRENEWAQNLT